MTKPSPAHRRRLRFFTTIALLPFVLLALNGTVALYSPTLILSMARPRDLSKICCGPGCRLPVTGKVDQVTTHYDNNYFQWQTQLGREKASSKDWNKFLDVKPTDTVADLGAGGGHILASLNVSRRIAVEINPIARGSIHKNYPGKVETFSYPEDVPDNSVDFLFSTSAIEHFECPLTELREMARKVRKGGRVMIGVKNEGVQSAVLIPISAKFLRRGKLGHTLMISQPMLRLYTIGLLAPKWNNSVSVYEIPYAKNIMRL
ncbi:unnamed protein product [Agarophyton chilense]